MDQTNKTFFSKGLYWPWGIVVFFVVLALADVVIVYYAFSRHPDRTTLNAYDDATRYEAVIEETRRAKEWGLKAELSVTKGTGLKQNLSLYLQAAKPGDLVRAQLRHAQYADSDRLVEFLPSSGPERFVADIELPRSGNWEAEVTVIRNQLVARFSLPLAIN